MFPGYVIQCHVLHESIYHVLIDESNTVEFVGRVVNSEMMTNTGFNNGFVNFRASLLHWFLASRLYKLSAQCLLPLVNSNVNQNKSGYDLYR